jgi:hypothetical protein
VARQQTRYLLSQQVGLLIDAGISHLSQVHAPKATGGVDHEQSGRVVDLAGLDLNGDVVVGPDALELGRGARQEAPGAHHPV